MEVGGRMFRGTASRRAAAAEKEREPVKIDKKEKVGKKKKKNLKDEVDNLKGEGAPPAVVPSLQQNLLENDAGGCTTPAPYRVPFRNLFSKSFEQTKKSCGKT